MKRNPVEAAGVGDGGEHLVFVIDPSERLAVRGIVRAVYVLIACAVGAAPGSGGLRNDFVVWADRFDRVITFAEAGGVVGGGDIIETGTVKRPFGGEIEFVADEPDAAAG